VIANCIESPPRIADNSRFVAYARLAMHHLILCTCPSARHLVEAHLAACVNILPGLRSVYLWQGEIEAAQEQLLLIKSAQSQYAAIESAIKTLHPYQLPEIIALPIQQGSAEYLQWIDSCLVTS
jgi:periplasmic divalent cation tolerance protein